MSLVRRVPQHDSLLLIADGLCHGFPPVQLPTLFFHFTDLLEQKKQKLLFGLIKPFFSVLNSAAARLNLEDEESENLMMHV